MSTPPSARLLMVSNRLPVAARVESGRARIRMASGGLATGLRSWYTQNLERRLARRNVVSVHAHEVADYCEGVANRVVVPAPDFGERQAHELRMLFGDALSSQPLEVPEGHKTVEIGFRGVNKGHVVDYLGEAGGRGCWWRPATTARTRTSLRHCLLVPCRLPSVGPPPARYRLDNWREVRQWLEQTLTPGRSQALRPPAR